MGGIGVLVMYGEQERDCIRVCVYVCIYVSCEMAHVYQTRAVVGQKQEMTVVVQTVKERNSHRGEKGQSEMRMQTQGRVRAVF
jgi:hypothetical protein